MNINETTKFKYNYRVGVCIVELVAVIFITSYGLKCVGENNNNLRLLTKVIKNIIENQQIVV